MGAPVWVAAPSPPFAEPVGSTQSCDSALTLRPDLGNARARQPALLDDPLELVLVFPMPFVAVRIGPEVQIQVSRIESDRRAHPRVLEVDVAPNGCGGGRVEGEPHRMCVAGAIYADDVRPLPGRIAVAAVPSHDEAIPRPAALAGASFADGAGRDEQDGLVLVVPNDGPGPHGLDAPLLSVDGAPNDTLAWGE